MPPFIANMMPRAFDPSRFADETRNQWIQPSDVFSVLLILGGDVIARAMAQVAGSGLTTVAFSFGWVAYSISALVSAVGDNKLLSLEPDCKCKVIHGKSGYAKENSSWILGRIVRDFPHWRHPDIQAKTMEVLHRKQSDEKMPELPSMAGLIVSIYRPSATLEAGHISNDLVYWIGLPVTFFQLGIAAIPCGIFGDWGILLITGCGMILCFLTGLFPQWKKEKWACRKNARDNFVLTRGNGSQHAIVVLGNDRGLNLEDLASGQSNTLVETSILTRLSLVGLAFLWILLLITAAGLKSNTWFLLAVGAIGILQNIYVAGAQRRPENFGIPLDFVEVFGEPKVMETLYKVEEKYKDIGHSMLAEFFPGELRQGEKDRWAQVKRNRAAKASK